VTSLHNLRKIPSLQSCADRDLLAFMRFTHTTDFKSETVIIAQGQPAQGAFFIVSGRCRAEVQRGDRRMVLGRLAPGDVFGELGLYSCGMKRSATVVAEEDVEALLILPESLNQEAMRPVIDELERRALASVADRIRRSSAKARRFSDEDEDDDPSSTWVSSVMSSLRRLVGG
jgi:CRP-like cAMP-binding protein